MTVAEILEAMRRLPEAERRELVEHIWRAWPLPEGVYTWKPLKTEIDALLDNADRLKRAQHLLNNLQEPDAAAEPTTDPVPEGEVSAAEPQSEDAPKPIPGKAFADILAEVSRRPPPQA
jgi:hypothetical protein